MRLLKTKIFEKKANIFKEKKMWPIFFRSIEHDKGQGTIYKDPEGNLTSIMQAIWSFL